MFQGTHKKFIGKQEIRRIPPSPVGKGDRGLGQKQGLGIISLNAQPLQFDPPTDFLYTRKGNRATPRVVPLPHLDQRSWMEVQTVRRFHSPTAAEKNNRRTFVIRPPVLRKIEVKGQIALRCFLVYVAHLPTVEGEGFQPLRFRGFPRVGSVCFSGTISILLTGWFIPLGN